MQTYTPFERYADDIVIHCHNQEEAEQILIRLSARMKEFELELHPEKTKIVYCKNYLRKARYDNESFIFLSYSFQPRVQQHKFGRKKVFLSFDCAISSAAKGRLREAIRAVFNPRWTERTLAEFAKKLNPKLHGWINYYARFNSHEALPVFSYLNELIKKWIKNKYKLRSMKSLYVKFKTIQTENINLFYHWTKEVRT